MAAWLQARARPFARSQATSSRRRAPCQTRASHSACFASGQMRNGLTGWYSRSRVLPGRCIAGFATTVPGASRSQRSFGLADR